LCHGDLSPANVMIGQDGAIRLLDFGLGNSSRSERRVTPEFAAPEVLNGQTANFSADLWSLGQILRRLFNNQNLLPKWVEDLLYVLPPSRMWSAANVLAPSSLVAKVHNTIERCNSQKDQTCELSNKRLGQDQLLQRSRSMVAALMICLLILAGAHSSVGRTAPLERQAQALAQISLRSNFGIEFELNGRKLGFAPIDVSSLEHGDYILRWKFAGLQYERALTLQAGEHIVINDQILANP